MPSTDGAAPNAKMRLRKVRSADRAFCPICRFLKTVLFDLPELGTGVRHFDDLGYGTKLPPHRGCGSVGLRIDLSRDDPPIDLLVDKNVWHACNPDRQTADSWLSPEGDY